MLAKDVENAPRGTKNQTIKSFAQAWNSSFATVSRDLATVRNTNRKPRADKGKSKITDEEVMLVVNLAVQSARQSGKQLTSINDAVENAKANGVVREDVSASTVLRVARQVGCHPTQILRPTPHQ